MPLLRLQCTVQNYAWGSQTSIPQLLKQEPDGQPWAELWMGAHPKASSHLKDGQSLADYLAKEGQSELPFLFKILAAAQPLSIQCHPNLSQAQEGFEAEQQRGVPLTAAHRNYRDQNHKPELIVALEEFWALKGFRSPAEIRALFEEAEVSCLGELLEELTAKGGLRAFFPGLLALEAENKTALLKALHKGATMLPEPEARWTQELLSRYPNDVGSAAPLLLRLVRLEAGQGLYLEAGELHAYLQGTGLEIMANSDNVLRGGLTPKHIDRQELSRVLQFTHKPLAIIEPQADGSYATPAREFSLSSTSLKLQPVRISIDSQTILLSLGGSAVLSSKGEPLKLPAGGVAFATSDVGPVDVLGDGRLWRASGPV